jgi:hypothetical protein
MRGNPIAVIGAILMLIGAGLIAVVLIARRRNGGGR